MDLGYNENSSYVIGRAIMSVIIRFILTCIISVVIFFVASFLTQFVLILIWKPILISLLEPTVRIPLIVFTLVVSVWVEYRILVLIFG